MSCFKHRTITETVVETIVDFQPVKKLIIKKHRLGHSSGAIILEGIKSNLIVPKETIGKFVFNAKNNTTIPKHFYGSFSPAEYQSLNPRNLTTYSLLSDAVFLVNQKKVSLSNFNVAKLKLKTAVVKLTNLTGGFMNMGTPLESFNPVKLFQLIPELQKTFLLRFTCIFALILIYRELSLRYETRKDEIDALEKERQEFENERKRACVTTLGIVSIYTSFYVILVLMKFTFSQLSEVGEKIRLKAADIRRNSPIRLLRGGRVPKWVADLPLPYVRTTAEAYNAAEDWVKGRKNDKNEKDIRDWFTDDSSSSETTKKRNPLQALKSFPIKSVVLGVMVLLLLVKPTQTIRKTVEWGEEVARSIGVYPKETWFDKVKKSILGNVFISVLNPTQPYLYLMIISTLVYLFYPRIFSWLSSQSEKKGVVFYAYDLVRGLFSSIQTASAQSADFIVETARTTQESVKTLLVEKTDDLRSIRADLKSTEQILSSQGKEGLISLYEEKILHLKTQSDLRSISKDYHLLYENYGTLLRHKGCRNENSVENAKITGNIEPEILWLDSKESIDTKETLHSKESQSNSDPQKSFSLVSSNLLSVILLKPSYYNGIDWSQGT
jgi:hypothetical protein